MASNGSGNPVTHFGRQMRKERTARGWSLREFAARSGINFATASRIENGRQPPSEKIALKCDAVFPERRDWFTDYYEESKSWTPPGFKDWSEYEDKATLIQLWSPGTIHGLLQTEAYTRALLATNRDTTDEIIRVRLASRMERQRRVLMREDPPMARCVIDHTALYRLVGSPEITAEQMGRLLEVAAMPNVTLQVLPAVAHPATASEVIVTDSAAYTEDVMSGRVYTDDQTVGRLSRLFDMLRAECYRASESTMIIRKAGSVWTGESRATAAPTAGPA